MQKKIAILILLIISSTYPLSAQFIGFEKETIPPNFQSSDKHGLAISNTYYKEGQKSLEWNFSPESTLKVQLETPLTLNKDTEAQYGITLWIYNEVPRQDSIRFEFLSLDGKVSYRFGFRLVSSGWRACWIGFRHMQKEKGGMTIGSYRLTAPDRKGRIFLDRLTFPVKRINERTTPDLQMPTNNSLSFRDLWHWCRVWQWEQYDYDLLLPDSLTPQEINELQTIEQRLTLALTPKEIPSKVIEKAYITFQKAGIRRSGSGFIGAPIVAPDELNRNKGEISWNDLETMLSGFAYDAYCNHSKISLNNYFTVWNFAINQGFAFGSGMGTNHHYGYQIRKIYTTAWLMRNAIWKSSHRNDILATLAFWSALQETRKPYQFGRDELLDSWHTLLTAKIVSALMFIDERERARALKGLSRWLSTSLQYTPGTIGGIKVDGTTFHHGGFYPAYTTGVLASIGQYMSYTNGTEYAVTQKARQVLKSACLAMRNYCNKYEWGIGISGRHPFGGSMKDDDIATFAYLALSGDLSGEGNTFDHHLAADYLRLCREDTPEAQYFKKQGIQPADAPTGFFVYNYGATGIFRRNNWMVTLKGYNTDVWGAEIYRKDNRYGRYQSYGSVQIMGYPSRKASGYDENGWDWNRLPGTTSIHLPFELLDSPLSGTTMVHSKENFAGSSSLKGENGLFAIKLMERNLKNFTPDFVARKSVFCFNNRMICIGSGISNSNKLYPTETTLFQSIFNEEESSINIDGKEEKKVDICRTFDCHNGQSAHIRDDYDNHYFIKEGNVTVRISKQESRHEKTRAITHGTFASAWINHGKAPMNEFYEYMVWIQPSTEELACYPPLNTYAVIQRNDTAHIVRDLLTGISAYAVFETFSPHSDDVFLRLPAETLIMRQSEENNRMKFSVCDPNLNISEKAYTTKEPSRIIQKDIELAGHWKLIEKNERVKVSLQQRYTLLTISCQHGQPVEFELIKEKK